LEDAQASELTARDCSALRTCWWDHLLMDEGDPEERIAELERQHTQAPGQARRDQAQHLNLDSPEKAARDKRSRQWTRFAIFVIPFGLMFFGFAACNSHAYHVGTPTTATNVHCVTHPRTLLHRSSTTSCTGTWSIDGRSHTGDVVGSGDRSSVDVRVHDGTAYAQTGATTLVSVGAVFIIIGSVMLWVKRARRRAGGNQIER
jgi:hypothetical protein